MTIPRRPAALADAGAATSNTSSCSFKAEPCRSHLSQPAFCKQRRPGGWGVRTGRLPLQRLRLLARGLVGAGGRTVQGGGRASWRPERGDFGEPGRQPCRSICASADVPHGGRGGQPRCGARFSGISLSRPRSHYTPSLRIAGAENVPGGSTPWRNHYAGARRSHFAMAMGTLHTMSRPLTLGARSSIVRAARNSSPVSMCARPLTNVTATGQRSSVRLLTWTKCRVTNEVASSRGTRVGSVASELRGG